MMDQFSQTDSEQSNYIDYMEEGRTAKDMEIEELKQTIAEKKRAVDILKIQISDTEARIKTHNNESTNSNGKSRELEEIGDNEYFYKQDITTKLALEQQPFEKDSDKNSLITILRDELKAVKDENLKKEEEIVSWKLSVLEHEGKVKTFVTEKKQLLSRLKSAKTKISSKVDKLASEKESDKKISAQLIESQKSVHEKEMQDLNLKLQTQIHRSQSLKLREKSLVEEVKILNSRCALIGKKDELIKSLTSKVESLTTQCESLTSRVASLAKQVVNPKVEMSDKAESSKSNKSADLKFVLENLDEKDSEIYRLHEKIAALDKKAKKLDMEVEDLKDELFSKSKESLDLQHCFENYKEVSQDNIAEKDKMLSCLEKELERTKDDAGIIVEEIEKCSKKKLSYEKTIEDMKLKFGRYREIISLLKDSLAGLAAMHEDTSDKLINAVQNTTHASQVVMNDVKEKLSGFDTEMEGHDSNFVVQKALNNNFVTLKKEPQKSSSSKFKLVNEEAGSSSKNAKLVAEDLSLEFDLHFGLEERSHEHPARGSGDDSGRRSTSRSSKKRKFTE